MTGLYASWLEVGTIEALQSTAYGQTLILKGILLLPILALAAFHLTLGWRRVFRGPWRQIVMTIGGEALLVLAVLLVVGRLIGLEPARTELASRTPSAIDVPLTFATEDGPRDAHLEISPGVAGNNDFVLDVTGAPLPDGTEAVLRFALPDQDIGGQELQLAADGQNRFHGAGTSLALAGDWQLDAVVRKIRDFSWSTSTTVAIGEIPPFAPALNPAPRFTTAGVAGLVAIVIGICGIAATAVCRFAAPRRRTVVAIASLVANLSGSIVLANERVPEPVAAWLAPATPSASSPAATLETTASPTRAATPTATPKVLLAGIGTPVASGDLVVTMKPDQLAAGPTSVTVSIQTADCKPVTGARAAIITEMTGMGGKAETPAIEAEPGQYIASGIDFGMAGEWNLSVRVSPPGGATRFFAFAVSIPG